MKLHPDISIRTGKAVLKSNYSMNLGCLCTTWIIMPTVWNLFAIEKYCRLKMNVLVFIKVEDACVCLIPLVLKSIRVHFAPGSGAEFFS